MSNQAINLSIEQLEQVEELKLSEPTKQIKQLEADKRRIEDIIDRLEHQLQAEIDPNVDEADPNLTSQVITLALLDNAREKVEAIERALNQARAGGYGICEDCGQPIDPERMEIFPQATRCVVCKSAQENLGRWQKYRVA